MTVLAVSSAIDSVTVYRRGALVTRVAKLEPVDGAIPGAIRLNGLCLGLDDTSVRARIEAHEAGTGALPVAHDLRVALDVSPDDPALGPADDAALENARAEVDKLERRCRQIEREAGRLQKLSPMPRPAGAKGERPPPSPLNARRTLIAFRAERERALFAELAATRESLEHARRLREKLEDRERRASSARNPREDELRKTLLVSLRGGTNQPCRLVVEYLVPGARWAPVYTVRLDESMTTAKLAMRAEVAQRTGEDWNQVAITLSTASAQAWTELPELRSMRIGRHQPPSPKLGWRPPPPGTDDLYRDWDRAFGRPDVAPLASPAPEPKPDVAAALDDDAELEAAPAMSVGPLGGKVEAPQASGAAFAPPARIARMSSRATAKERRKKVAPAMPPDAPPPPQVRSEGAEEPTTLTAPAKLLRYGDLRMPPPTARARGRLTAASRRDLYLEHRADPRTEHVDVMSAVDAALQRARALDNRQISGHELVWSDAFDHAYPATARIDVPSDGELHVVPLLERTATCESLYVVVPRESPDVFSTATLDNPLDAPLLPGPVDVYVNGDFLLATRIDVTPARGQLSLGLGVEQAIKVARNTTFAEETAGLMGGSLILRHSIALDVRNNLARPAPLEIRERIPVTREKDDEVEVRVAKVSPKWETWEQDLEEPGEPPLRGGYRWRITVPAGGHEKLAASYEIKISAKHELHGGNRREV